MTSEEFTALFNKGTLYGIKCEATRPDAEDAAQYALLKLLDQSEPPANLQAWYFTVVRRRLIDMWRSSKTHSKILSGPYADQSDVARDPADIVESKLEASEMLEKLAESRSTFQKRCGALRAFGFTCPEIAGALGVSLPAAKKGVYRAAQKMAEASS